MCTPGLANPGLVPPSHENAGKRSSLPQAKQGSPLPPKSTRRNPPNEQELTSHSLSLVRKKLITTNNKLSSASQDIILASWRDGTAKQYKTYLARWEAYCNSNSLDMFNPGIENAIEFLTDIFKAGSGYSAINTARSALSSIIVLPNGATFGEHPLVRRFLKGVFELKPSLPKYNEIWDVSLVLEYLRQLPGLENISLKDHTKKLATLLCLLTGQRCQTIHKFDIKHIQFFQDRYFVNVREKLKHTRPGRHQDPFEFIPFTQDTRLCVVQCMKSYINRTKELRAASSKLVLSYIKPFKPVGKETIARWIKSVLKVSGVDIVKFSAHSCRSASTSRNQLAGLSLPDIMRSAGWSNASTFAKHYNKPIINENFGDRLLSDFVNNA